MRTRPDPHGRVTEWETSSRDEGSFLYLFAEAQYGRGTKPTDVEIEWLENRVMLKFPRAELVGITRTLVPRIGGGEPRRVRWQLKWLVVEG